jgi:hypothetical protein
VQLPKITALILLAFAGVGLATGLEYVASCDPAPTSDYQASYLAWAKLNCVTSEGSASAGTWHDDIAECEARPGYRAYTDRYYHPIFDSSSGGPKITARCHWVQA